MNTIQPANLPVVDVLPAAQLDRQLPMFVELTAGLTAFAVFQFLVLVESGEHVARSESALFEGTP